MFSKVMDYGSAKTTVPSVRLPMLQDFWVCVPPQSEQQDMISVLSEKVDKIEKLIAIKQSKIENWNNTSVLLFTNMSQVRRRYLSG